MTWITKLCNSTNISSVVVATGLMALVDDCIKERWQTKRVHQIALPLTSRKMEVELRGPRAFVQHMFSRHSSDSQSATRFRYDRAVAAY
jgi:hypothetical protein